MEALENNTLARFVIKVERNAARAYKTVTFKEFLELEERTILSFRKQTLFSNLKSTQKHWLGAHYTVQQGALFLIPTNLPGVNHLDLEQHAFNMEEYYEPIRKVPEALVIESTQNHPLIDTTYKHVNLTSVAKDFLAIYYGHVKAILEKEYEHCAMVSLSKKYDVKKFSRVMNSHLSKGRNSHHSMSTLSALFMILYSSSKDNAFITYCTRKIFVHLHFKDFISSLPYAVVDKLFESLRHSSKGSRSFGKDRHWILSERFVEHAFMRADVKLMKTLLLQKCPSSFMAEFALEKYSLPDAQLWSRKKVEGSGSDDIHSYYSLKYYIYISCLLASFVSVSRAEKSDITKCIRLFWKSIPTPIIPLNDMQEFFLKLNQHFQWGPLWPALQYFPKEFGTCVYQPRSLQHLSRFVVMQNSQGPSYIESLDIPKQMHSYLRLEFDEFLQ